MEIQTTLVILLSIGFFGLLVVSITLGFLLIKLVRTLQRISLKAEEGTENLVGATKVLGKRLAPAAASALVATLFRRFRTRK